MNNKKLKIGDIVTYKNGNKAIFIDKNNIVFENGCIGRGINWPYVQKVERNLQLFNFHEHGIRTSMNYYCLKTIYEAKEILDEVEKEYLNGVIKPFKKKVVSISKADNIRNEYLKFNVLGEPNIMFPDFKKGTMYTGMKSGKEYSLKELGLED